MQSLPANILGQSKGKKSSTQLNFEKKIASELLGDNKENIDKQSRRKRPLEMEHRLLKVPDFCGKWNGRSWDRSVCQYLQQRCACKKKTRSYCACNKLVFYCVECFANHLVEVK
jgi:hypothetical protein